jgi:hypothetical protein
MTPDEHSDNQFKLPVTDPTLVELTLFQLGKTIEMPEGMDMLIRNGWDPLLVDQIRHVPARDIPAVAQNIKHCFISICPNDLATAIRRIADRRRDRAKLEYFIQHGAPRNMVLHLWLMSISEQAEVRKCIADRRRDRVPTPPPDRQRREAIQRAWYDIARNKTLSKKDQIYQLHQQFQDLTIETVYNIATELDGDHRVRHRRQGVRHVRQ